MGQGQRQPVGGTTHDTVNTRVLPIVFVPGVMGTRLDINGTVADWDPDDNVEMADWVASSTGSVRQRIHFRTGATPMAELVRFSVVHDEPVDPVRDILARPRLVELSNGRRRSHPTEDATRAKLFYERRGWGSVVWSFYGPILMHLQEQMNPGPGGDEPHPVYAVGYDWRQSNADSGNFLLTSIQTIIANHATATQVVIVSHSMGGLVTRATLAQNQGAEPLVAGVVHTVMPADGTVVAYRRFFTGARHELDDGSSALCKILGDSPLEYLETQSGARGPMELLPHDSYPDVFFTTETGDTNHAFESLFEVYMRDVPPGIIPPAASSTPLPVIMRFIPELRERLVEASAFTKSIAGCAHPNTVVLLGDSLLTDVAYDWRQTGGERIIKGFRGDGTVPAPSAEFRAGTVRSRIPFAVEHADCFKKADFRVQTEQQLRIVLAYIS